MEKTMETTTPAVTAPAPAKKARKVVVRTGGAAKKVIAKSATTTKSATPAKAASAPKVNLHREAGVNADLYGGPSGMFNNNRKAAIMDAPARATGSLTERHQKGLYALRGKYGETAFVAKGFDNGILRDLKAAGLISVSGGVTETINGSNYHIDGETPVKVKITKAGAAYGRA